MANSKITIHIISFDIPVPQNYGGVIDIFYKLKALHDIGVKVILHCFEYGRAHSEELNKVCSKVYYYKRKTFINPLFGDLPYIVNTRYSAELMDCLLKDNYPILFEGLHTTYFLGDKRLSNRFKIVRTHNVEHDYYKNLEEVESNWFKKYFFRLEAERLKKYEKKIKKAELILAISPSDVSYFTQKYGHGVKYLPAFQSNQALSGELGKGEFALYHGNLAVGENNFAALYLVNEIFSEELCATIPLIIAGQNPSKALIQAVKGRKNITLISHINTEEIHDLIKKAQINVLPTFQSTGIKLKLLNALFIGRHCVVNDLMVNNTGLEKGCEVCTNQSEMKEAIKKCWKLPFDTNLMQIRATLLKSFDNKENAEKLLKWITSA